MSDPVDKSGWVEAMRQQQRVERALLLAANWDRKAGQPQMPPGDYSEASVLIRCRNLILRDCARELRSALKEVDQ